MAKRTPSEYKNKVTELIVSDGSQGISAEDLDILFKDIPDSFVPYFSVADDAAMNSIAEINKSEGMIVFVQSRDRLYYLNNSQASYIKIPIETDVQALIDQALGGGKLLSSLTTKAQLKDLDNTSASDYPDKSLILVDQEGLFRLSRVSTETDNNDTIIQPTLGVGRWIRITDNKAIHNNLSEVQGGTSGQFYHLTQEQHTVLSDIGSNSDITGLELETLSDSSNADSLHKHNKYEVQKCPIKTITADYEASLLDGTLLVDCVAGDIEIGLPEIVSSNGYIFNIKKIDSTSNILTIVPYESFGARTQIALPSEPEFISIEFGFSVILSQKGEVVNLQSNGQDWYLIQ